MSDPKPFPYDSLQFDSSSSSSSLPIADSTRFVSDYTRQRARKSVEKKMGNRNKEDERIERAIRSLMKLPENRRCINCNNLGPQYVCTTFSTFVCMNCSGIHREFTHRVKSVSVAKFTAEEVTALQAGGNERARQVHFRQWDLQRHSFPDSSNLNKLRDFIKHVYVDRKYGGDRSSTVPLRHSSNKKADSHRSRSSYDEGIYEKSLAGRRFGKSDDLPRRSHYSHPKNTPLSSVYPWSGSQRRNPVRFEVVDDRVRDEGFGSCRFSHGDATMQRRLSNKTNANMERAGSPAVRPLEEILGENLPTLRVGEIPKESNGENADRSASNQDSGTGKPGETKIETTQSLIDFDAETEPSNAVSPSQTQQTSSLGGGSSRASPENQNSSKESQVPKVKTLESLLFELSVPSLNTMDGMSEVPGGDVLPEPLQRIPQSIDGVDGVPNQPSIHDDILQGTSGDGTAVKAIEWPFESIQQTQKASPSLADASSSFPHLTTSIGAQDNEPSFASLVHNEVGSSSVLPFQPSQSVSRPVQDVIAGAENQPLPEAPKSSSRMELPVHLFTASYPSMATPISGWQSVPPQGMGFNYYPSTMPVSAFPSQAKSTNPFDMSDEQSQFPSMSSLHTALPNVLPASSSLGNCSSQLTSPQSLANAYLMPQQLTYIGSAFSPSTYMGQEVHNNIQPSRPQGFGGPVGDGDVFVSINTAQQPAAIYSDHVNPNSSMGGNPFG